MKTLCEKFEFYLIVAGLFSGLVIPIRSLFIDSFIVILIIPLIALVILCYLIIDFHFNDFALDILIYLYLFYGFVMTLVGLVTSPFKVHVLETFVHYYLPSVFYFISRKFSSYSLSNFYRSIQLVRHLAIFFIVNMFIEWALYDFDMRHLVPWAGLGQDQEGLVKFSVEWYGLGFDRVGSVLTSTKTTEMVLASLFCFILQ